MFTSMMFAPLAHLLERPRRGRCRSRRRSRARRTARDPVTFVRSPIIRKLRLGRDGQRLEAGRSGSGRRGAGGVRGVCSSPAAAIGAMWSGRGAAAAADDVHQAASANSRSIARRLLGALVVPAEGVGQAGVRVAADVQQVGDRAPGRPCTGRISAAPSAQLMPTLNGRACATVDPERLDRLARERAAAAVGDRHRDHHRQARARSPRRPPRSRRCAAFALSVSKIVSTRSRSTPPSTRPRTCSA